MMPNNTWPDRLARAFAMLRGAVLVLYSVMLFIEPEKVVAGSSSEPARTLARNGAHDPQGGLGGRPSCQGEHTSR